MGRAKSLDVRVISGKQSAAAPGGLWNMALEASSSLHVEVLCLGQQWDQESSSSKASEELGS